MRVGAVRKTPEDRRDFDVGFADWLPPGDALIDVEAFLASDNGLIIDAVSLEGSDAKVWLSGGEAGTSNEVEVRVTTAQGRIKTACFRVRIINC